MTTTLYYASHPSAPRRDLLGPARAPVAAAHARPAAPPTPHAPEGDERPERLWLHAADGYRLGAVRYHAAGPVRGHVVVAGAIGVPQGFYRRFGEFAQTRGYTTWTLDYRGVGPSAPPGLRGFRADLRDWGRLDLAAAVDAAADAARFDRAPVYLVGHSFGGHALGLLPNHDRLRAAFAFGIGAGWHGWMPPAERARVLALWHLAGPLLTRWTGYLPWRLVGMGEDLPLGVYRQWKRWCRGRRFCFDDPDDGPALAEAFARVRTPLVAANAIDDRWSPPRSRDVFVAGFSGTTVHRIDVDPAVLGTGPLGHLGYFRPAARPLWYAALAWLDARAA